MTERITAVLIDTSAYHNRQCDFSGMTNAMIPTFLRLLETNNIPVLSHHILDNEIRKHIEESDIIKKTQNLTDSIKKCKGVLASVGLSATELMETVSIDTVKRTLLDAYEEFSRKFIVLPYVEAQEVFSDYFSAKPPFSATGPKKTEFPDAFILKGLLKYCETHPEEHILVVSNDKDWKNTLSGNEQIAIADTLQIALKTLWPQLCDKTEFVSRIWGENIPKIMTAISDTAAFEAYSIDGIDELESISVTDIRTTSMIGNMTPLEITDDSALIHATVSLSLDGKADYFDESRSLWDKEDQCYYLKSYSRIHFQDASAEAECEVRLNFPADGSMKNIIVQNVRITNKWDICIDLSDADTYEEDITHEDDDYYWRAE